MNKLVSAIVFLWTVSSVSSFAGVTVTTVSGKTYEDGEVNSVSPDSVSLKHSGGISRILFSDLSRATRQSLNLKMTVPMAKGDFLMRISGDKKILSEFDDTYEGYLTKLAKEALTQGNLDDVLETKKELSEFRSGAKPDGIKYEKLKKLRLIYDRERVRRRNKIIENVEAALKQFQTDLKGVQKELTIANKLDEAIATKKDEEKIIGMLADLEGALKILGIESNGETEAIANAGQPAMGKADSLSATKGKLFENSLGMRFLPVPITGGPSEGKQILFSIWETRVSDYETFIKKDRGRQWPKPDFAQKGDHPVVNVSWDDAVAFCKWLTEIDQKNGKIGKDELYRLPTDHEWSCAVGIGDIEDSGAAPGTKSGKNLEAYPWGVWPLKAGSGNYAGQEMKGSPLLGEKDPLFGYNDGHERSAPVGSFDPNEYGIFDLGGNVWEWCDDWMDPVKQANRVARGASWVDSLKVLIHSTRRGSRAPLYRYDYYGFRVVIERAGNNSKQKEALPASVAEAGLASKEHPFENSLEMRFVPVPITGGASDGKHTLFSIWETRIQDYKEFTKNNVGQEFGNPKFAQEDDHPVTNVTWDNAVAFCEWLTELDRKRGKLGKDKVYRLPTDHEWSCAVGIGKQEDPNTSPQEKSAKIENAFPWGNSYPPKKGAGNYYGEEVSSDPESDGRKIIPDYNDGFLGTAPVGSFDANEFGLYDLGGNLWEWCSDFVDPEKKVRRVLRGHSWNGGDAEYTLRSSFRGHSPPDEVFHNRGFRIVIGDSSGE